MLHILRTAAAVALALGSAATARAQGLVLTHSQSVYADGKPDGKAVALKAPEGVACRAGVVVVADTGNRRIVRFASKDGAFAGSSELRAEELRSPGRIELDSKGGVWVLDQKSRRIARFDEKGAFAGFVEVKGAKGGPVVVDAFKLDALDVLYVLDGAGKRVLALDAAGSVTREVALPKTGVFMDFAVEPGGRLFAVDGVKATVWAAAPGAAEFKPLSPPLKEYMSFPAYITTARGALLVLDQNGHGLVTVGTDGAYRGRQLAMGWGDGLVYYPAQLCLGEAELIIADRYNNRVQVFTYR